MRRAAARGTALLVGLCGYGFSMAVMVRAGLGLDPWDVFHQGLTRHTGMTIGVAVEELGRDPLCGSEDPAKGAGQF